MESQFRQPKQVINVEVNKQSIARNFGIGDNEVCYAKAGQPLTGYKAIYDKASQRAYVLPTGLTGTVTSFSTDGLLTYSGGTVDLAALAVERGDYFHLNQTFVSGATLVRKNETLAIGAKRYRWAGTFPKTVPANSNLKTAGGIASNAWVEVNAEVALGKPGASLQAWNDVVHLRDFTEGTPYANLMEAVQAAMNAAKASQSKVLDAHGWSGNIPSVPGSQLVAEGITIKGGRWLGTGTNNIDIWLHDTTMDGIYSLNLRWMPKGGNNRIINSEFEGHVRTSGTGTIVFQHLEYYLTDLLPNGTPDERASAAGDTDAGTFEIDTCVFRGGYFGILQQPSGGKVSKAVFRNLSFYDMMGDAIELNVVQKSFDNGCVIENIAIFTIDADKAGINTPSFQSNWGIGIGLAGKSPYGYEIPDTQYVKNFAIRNVYAEGVRQVIHVEVGRDFVVENIYADPDNTVSRGSGLSTATVYIVGSKRFNVRNIYGEPKPYGNTPAENIRVIMLQWGTNQIYQPDGTPYDPPRAESSNACFDYTVQNVYTKTGLVWGGCSAGPNTDNTAIWDNITCKVFQVFGIATHLSMSNIFCEQFKCVGHPESGDGAFPNNFVRSDKTKLTMVNVNATDEWGQGGQFFSRCRYSKVNRSGGNVYAEPWVNFTGALGPLMVPVGQVYYQATGPHGADGSYFPSGKEFNTSDAVLTTKNGVTTIYIVTESGMYIPDNDNFAIRAAAVGTKTIVQQKVPNGESTGSPWLFITQFEPGARITIPGAGPGGTDLKTRVVRPPYQTPPSDSGAIITMDIADAIQTAVPAGTRIKATYPLTTRPSLPTT